MIEALIKEKKMLYVCMDWFHGDFDVIVLFILMITKKSLERILNIN
jgi:hypothetical protein